MPIRQQISAPECVEQFEKAASERYEAGFILLASNSVIGVDEMCLAAEMILKAAYFRYAGFPPTLPIQQADRQAATPLALSATIQYGGDPQHNLRFWVEAIIGARLNGFAARQHPSGTTLAAVSPADLSSQDKIDLRFHADTLRNNAQIGDRYLSRQVLVTPQDMEAVFDAFIGILDLYERSVL